MKLGGRYDRGVVEEVKMDMFKIHCICDRPK